MLKTLSITLHNGKAGPESERLHIRCTEGPYYWTYHISHETRGECTDVANTGERADMLVDCLDIPKWWCERINEEIQQLFNIPSPPASLLESLGMEGTVVVRNKETAWTLLIDKEVFAEDKWTNLQY